MKKRIVSCCVLVFTLLLSLNALAEKKQFTRQLGGACGEDANIVATCDVGLTCKDGYCAMKSFLSAQTVGCKDEMKKAGWTSYVAVHDGFCYVNGNCRAMYDAAMAASDITTRLLVQAKAGSEAFSKELAKLSEEEKATFKHAEDTCNSCGKYCTIGSGFLDRGGY